MTSQHTISFELQCLVVGKIGSKIGSTNAGNPELTLKATTSATKAQEDVGNERYLKIYVIYVLL